MLVQHTRHPAWETSASPGWVIRAQLGSPGPRLTQGPQMHISRAQLGRAGRLRQTDHAHGGPSSANMTSHEVECHLLRQNREQRMCPTLLNVKRGWSGHLRGRLRPQTQVWGALAPPKCCRQPQAARFHSCRETTGPGPPSTRLLTRSQVSVPISKAPLFC